MAGKLVKEKFKTTGYYLIKAPRNLDIWKCLVSPSIQLPNFNTIIKRKIQAIMIWRILLLAVWFHSFWNQIAENLSVVILTNVEEGMPELDSNHYLDRLYNCIQAPQIEYNQAWNSLCSGAVILYLAEKLGDSASRKTNCLFSPRYNYPL